jgi:pimeloyl-ACP methyl ester carboxylesterase
MVILYLTLFACAMTCGLAWAHDANLRRKIKQQLPPPGRFIETPRATLHYLIRAPKNATKATPVFVLIHGSSASCHDMMEALGEALAQHGTVLSFDRPGIGRSVLKVSAKALSHPGEQADEIHHAVGQLGYQNPIIIGHSWGGSVAMAYAQRYDQLIAGALVLAAPLYPWQGKAMWYNQLVTTRFIGRVFAHGLLTKYGMGQLSAGLRGNAYPESVADDYAQKVGLASILLPDNFITNAVYSNHLSDHLATLQASYASIQTPLILVAGDRDQTVHTKRNSHRFHGEREDCELIYIRNVGHMLHHTQSDKIIDAALRLANGSGPKPGIHEFGEKAVSDEAVSDEALSQ